MSIFEIIVAYAVSWWMLLFMVLPFGAQAPENPGKGHAASAPANPRLRRKMLITSVLAVIPVVIFGFVQNAAAESGIYHAGSKEPECADYTMPEGVEAETEATGPDTIRSGISVPTADYISDEKLRDRLYSSETYIGTVDVDRKGETRLNGKLMSGGGCKTK